MIKVGKWIAKHKVLIVLISMILLIPSVIGMAATRVNYDILSYLPDSLETVEGQDIMVDEFGMGAFSMVVVEDMDLKDVAALKEKFQDVEHVKDVLWYDSVADLSIPVSMIPDKFKDAFFNGDATMMIALFDNTTSSDAAMEAVTDMRKIANEQCFISGMSGVVTDIKNIALEEMPIYVVIAAGLSLLVLLLAMDSLVVPILFLLSVGLAVLYNLGSNIFLGQVCYITKSLTAVLQLGVTMDYSIFLLNSFEAYKKKYDEKERAMAHAIADTFKSDNGSGKSTLAKHLNAILLPSEGSVFVDGMDTKDMDKLEEIRQTAGMVFQNPDNQIIGTVVDEDVAFGPENMGVPTEEIIERVENSLKTVGMWEYRAHSPNRLSGGQKQRVAIAGVVAMEPKCIVLDEPTAMLDPVGRKEVIRAAQKLNREKGITIILITHYMEEVVEADRVIVMDQGKILMQGTPREVFSRVEELKEHRLDVPQVTMLAHELRKSGLNIPEGILTITELADALGKAGQECR